MNSYFIGRRAAIGLILLAALAMQSMTALSVYPIGYDTGFTTLILRVDAGSFDDRLLQGIGGIIVYKAELAPVVIVRVPSYITLNYIQELPGVLHVSHDGLVKAAPAPPGRGKPGSTQPSQVTPWGVDYVNAPLVWSSFGVTGYVDLNGDGDSEIEVAIIDSGVDQDHPDLYANIKWGIAVQNGRISSRYNDLNGHGTHVTGTVAALNNDIGVVGVAPDVEVYMVKALGASGSGTWSDLIIAIDLAVKGPDGVIDADGDGVIVGDPDDDAPEVISMSLGGSSPPTELHDIIIAAYNWNITIVAAAGNEGADIPSYPAAYPEVIAVGAINSTEGVPWWSNRNPEVTAPGVDILSTYPDDTYETLSGTSMATPHVSATVALMQAARLANNLDPLPPGTENDTDTSTIRGILHVTAKDLGSTGYDPDYGYGTIDAYEAVRTAIGA